MPGPVSGRDAATLQEFPAPAPQAAALSARLIAQIRAEIAAAGGAIPFSRYMELCLYSPGLGYYSAGATKFGAAGDFVTDPEISPLFGRCLAQTCGAVLQQTDGDILEFGAGSGKLAVDLLGALEQHGRLPARYYILEPSAELRERQRERLAAGLPRLAGRVVWLEQLPGSGFRGVALANEVLDAMPVERLRWSRDGIEQFYVGCEGEGVAWRTGAIASPNLAKTARDLQQACGLADGFVSEINPSLAPWINSIAARVEEGLLLLSDYGAGRPAYYHPGRSQGTLRCHYRHRAHDDPFLWPGLQDVTAHVDFTAVAEAAVAAGLEVAGFATQAGFLLDCGLEALLAETGPVDSLDYLKAAGQAKQLILPGEMGERFKFIGLTRALDTPLPGFRMQDLRGRL